MEEVITSYMKNKEHILKYQKNRLDNDPEFRKKYNDKRNEELKDKYKNDPEYRQKVIDRVYKSRELKKQQKLLMV